MLNKQKAKHPSITPVYARITRFRQSSYISLGITVDEEHWDEGTQRVNILHPYRIRMNARLGKVVNDIDRVILEDLDKNRNSSAKQLKEHYLGKTEISFSKYAKAKELRLLKEENYSRYKKLKGILSKLEEFTGGRELQFIEISYDFLVNYEEWLATEKKNRVNTIHTNLKFIRQLFREAIRDDIIDEDLNPFKRFELKLEKTTREFLSETELEAFERLNVLPEDITYDCYRMFTLACYTGLRISDLLTLRCRNYDGQHISITMRKTKDSLSIQVPTAGKLILEQYIQDKSDDEYIFPFLNASIPYSAVDLQKQIMSKTARCNTQLKILAKRAGITKNLTFHISRHTFATRALRKGIRIEYVSKLLGHADIKTTQVYAKIVNKELDKAMEVFG